jgi:hypothetical protein
MADGYNTHINILRQPGAAAVVSLTIFNQPNTITLRTMQQ